MYIVVLFYEQSIDKRMLSYIKLYMLALYVGCFILVSNDNISPIAAGLSYSLNA